MRLDKSAAVEGGEGALPASAGVPPPSPVKFRAAQSAPLPKKRGGGLSAIFVLVRELAVTAALAFVIACFVQMLRSPDGVVESKAPLEASASLLAADMQAARDNPYPRALVVTSDQANNFLAARLAPGTRETGSWIPVTFGRAFVAMESNAFTLTVEQAFLKLPVYLQLHFALPPGGSPASVQVVGGHIGRLPVPRTFLPVFEQSFTPTLKALDTPVEWLRSASSITVAPEGTTVNWPGKTR